MFNAEYANNTKIRDIFDNLLLDLSSVFLYILINPIPTVSPNNKILNPNCPHTKPMNALKLGSSVVAPKEGAKTSKTIESVSNAKGVINNKNFTG